MELDDKTLRNYLSGECTERQWEAIGRWLDESPENASRLFGLQLALELPQMRAFEEGSVVSAAEKSVLSRIGRVEEASRREAGRRRRRKIAWRWAFGAAAAALIAVGVFVFREGFTSRGMVRIAVAHDGEVKEISLPDGSKVWLNRASRIEYAAGFGRAQRSLHLDGEGYFEVARDDTSPFEVTTPAMRVRVLGTSFNLSSRAADTTSTVTLLTGSVEVRGNRGEGQIALSPGQKAEIDLVAKRMTVRVVDAGLDAIWHDNLIPFRDASISQIARSLELLYDVKIMLGGDLDSGRRYSGVVPRRNTVTDVLESLTNTIPITYSAAGDTILLSGSDRI